MNNEKGLTFDWRTDLLASRDLNSPEKRGFTILLEWFETWRINRSLQPSLETSRNFWKAQVLSKPREPWQKDQWVQAIRWYLKWLGFCEDCGHSGLTVEERVRLAVDQAGGRRGLARKTRQTYAGWAGRFACWAGDAKSAMDTGKAKEWLGWLVTDQKVSYSTQKQALNGLVFFFRDVCAMEAPDLQVKFRKTPKRIPNVFSLGEITAWKKEIRKWHEQDRAENRPGVALPGALARKYPKHGETWPWFWFLPSKKISTDPDTEIERRHHTKKRMGMLCVQQRKRRGLRNVSVPMICAIASPPTFWKRELT